MDRTRCFLAAVLAGTLILGEGRPVAAAPETDASRARQLDRVQLHRNGLRGLPYLSRWSPGGGAEPASFRFRVLRRFHLPGDPTDNLRSNFHVVDADGDGTFELLQIHGHRLARLFRQDGTVLWRAWNPDGRGHRTNVHRDTAAVLDVDGDGRQEVVHCWVYPGTSIKHLVLRRASDGKPLRNLALHGDRASSECHVAGFRVPGQAAPLLLVSRQLALPSASCPRRYTDLWPVTAAVDTQLRLLWQRDTCDAGHYAWPLDEDSDGLAEAVFVGKYLLRPDGSLRCLLPGWGSDHVDGLTVADFDPARPGHEVVAVGNTGTRTYSAGSCAPIASIPIGTIRNPQSTAAAVLSPGADAPTPFVRVKTIEGMPRLSYEITVGGSVLGRREDTNPREQVALMNGNLDGAQAAEDIVTRFGQVIDRDGRLRLGADWYWNLQTLTPEEVSLPPDDQWTIAPLVVDLDGDGRDEIVTWGRRLLVIGAVAP